MASRPVDPCAHTRARHGPRGTRGRWTYRHSIGSAVTVVLSGLGVRKAETSSIAPSLGLAAASGFLAIALNRAFGRALIGPLALVLGSGASSPGET